MFACGCAMFACGYAVFARDQTHFLHSTSCCLLWNDGISHGCAMFFQLRHVFADAPCFFWCAIIFCVFGLRQKFWEQDSLGMFKELNMCLHLVPMSTLYHIIYRIPNPEHPLQKWMVKQCPMCFRFLRLSSRSQRAFVSASLRECLQWDAPNGPCPPFYIQLHVASWLNWFVSFCLLYFLRIRVAPSCITQPLPSLMALLSEAQDGQTQTCTRSRTSIMTHLTWLMLL